MLNRGPYLVGFVIYNREQLLLSFTLTESVEAHQRSFDRGIQIGHQRRNKVGLVSLLVTNWDFTVSCHRLSFRKQKLAMHDRVNEGYYKKKKTGSVFVDNRCLTVEPVTQPSLLWVTNVFADIYAFTGALCVNYHAVYCQCFCSGTHDGEKLKCWDFNPPGSLFIVKQRVNICPCIFFSTSLLKLLE